MRNVLVTSVLLVAFMGGPGGIGSGTAGGMTLDLDVIQRAYDAAARTSGAAHIAGLVVRKADCAQGSQDNSLCWVKYTDESDHHGAQKSDVISLERQGSTWVLTSGLCLPPRKS